MTYFSLGFLTGLSLILAIGAQNIFVIEQGLKKQYVFLVCFICSISDLILIFFGIFIFSIFQNFFTLSIEMILNILLILFLLNFIKNKWKEKIHHTSFSNQKISNTRIDIFLKTLGFTYLNPHVYSDTVFFIGNFSKNFEFLQKMYFGIGTSFASLTFFFLIGYLANYFSNFLNSDKIWKIINNFIIVFMTSFIILILIDTFNLFLKI
ncbi:MAG: lysine transporter LysE [Pelagibacteraceae bacterium]|nr:lysine transporter LysE [Pelagibacteraceae bacterium]